jgi:hypothetical protein
MLENAIEGAADAVEDDQPATGCDDTGHNAAGIHQHVDEKDVDDDGTNQRKRQRHIAHSDDVDQSIRFDADQIGAKRRKAFSV